MKTEIKMKVLCCFMFLSISLSLSVWGDTWVKSWGWIDFCFNLFFSLGNCVRVFLFFFYIFNGTLEFENLTRCHVVKLNSAALDGGGCSASRRRWGHWAIVMFLDSSAKVSELVEKGKVIQNTFTIVSPLTKVMISIWKQQLLSCSCVTRMDLQRVARCF